jgi:hypothetical protein
MPPEPNLLIRDFFGQEFCSPKMESKALFFDGYGRGGGTSHLGPFPGPAQRHMQDNTLGGAVLAWGT